MKRLALMKFFKTKRVCHKSMAHSLCSHNKIKAVFDNKTDTESLHYQASER